MDVTDALAQKASSPEAIRAIENYLCEMRGRYIEVENMLRELGAQGEYPRLLMLEVRIHLDAIGGLIAKLKGKNVG